MTTEMKLEEINEDTTSVPIKEITVEETEVTQEQDPLKVELEKVQKREPKTEAEKAAYSLKKNAERFQELGGDVASILGFKKTEDVEVADDDAPVTVGMLKKMQENDVAKTALQLADEIDNETERELVKYHVQNTIRSTGNPQEDLKLARAIVNSVKNQQITEEVSRKSGAKTHSSSSSAPAKPEVVSEELTAAEMPFTQKPFNLTKEQIIASRGK